MTNSKTATVKRQVYVEQMMIQGLSPVAMSQLRDDKGKVLATYDTIVKDVAFIHTQWMNNDPEWMHRVHVARVKATMRLQDIQLKLNEFMQRSDDDVSVKEKMGLLALIMQNTMKLYEVEADLDPEQYLNQMITDNANRERDKKESMEDDGREKVSLRTFEQRGK
jgi:hypothetical protein